MFPEIVATFQQRSTVADECIIIPIRPALTKWSKPWNFVQYLSSFKEQLAKLDQGGQLTVLDREDSMRFRSAGGNSLRFVGFDKGVPLTKVIEEIQKKIDAVHEAAERQLTANLNRGSLVTFFDFPPAVKVACEQYLQYFIQFLEDLGIDADSEISSDAGKVLFSVTPRSGEEALGAIQEALAAFLAIPGNKNMGQDGMPDIAMMQLRANVSHLEGQLQITQGLLQLSQATIQHKDATINAQAMHIAMFQRDQLIQSSLPESLRIENSAPKPIQDSEPLIGNSVKVVPLKMKGFEVDLPNILRRLKRRLPSGN
jgi:hypothetical protein